MRENYPVKSRITNLWTMKLSFFELMNMHYHIYWTWIVIFKFYLECLLSVLICVCYRFGVISPGHQAILFRYCHVIICHRLCIYINSDICTSLLSVYICRYHLLSSFFSFFFYLYEIFKKKKEKLISNFNVRVKKNVFISVNKYTYIYILYIWNYIFFRSGRIFLWYIPMYIYI